MPAVPRSVITVPWHGGLGDVHHVQVRAPVGELAMRAVDLTPGLRRP